MKEKTTHQSSNLNIDII